MTCLDKLGFTLIFDSGPDRVIYNRDGTGVKSEWRILDRQTGTRMYIRIPKTHARLYTDVSVYTDSHVLLDYT